MIKKIIGVLKNPLILIPYFGSKGLLKWMPDKLYIKLTYRAMVGKKLNLENPQTFNEKLQWLKLYDRNPLYHKLVDKYEVREHIKELVGEEHLVPLLGVWNSFDEINFDDLPNQFVLKCTHDSGGHVICTDKNSFNIKYTKQIINSFMKRNYYNLWREWPYKNVKPRVICEKYLELNIGESLIDYKIYCFGGRPHFIAVYFNTLLDISKRSANLFDLEWNLMKERRVYPNKLPNPVPRPKKLDQMIKMAKTLSKGLPHVRVDLYYVEEKIYVGELTFYTSAGLGKFYPEEYNFELGNLIKLPEKNINY